MKNELQFNNEVFRETLRTNPSESFIEIRDVGHTSGGRYMATFETVAYYKDLKTVVHFYIVDCSRENESLFDFCKHAISMLYKEYRTPQDFDGYAWCPNYAYQFDTDEEAREYIENIKDCGYYGDITPTLDEDIEYHTEEYYNHFIDCGYDN